MVLKSTALEPQVELDVKSAKTDPKQVLINVTLVYIKKRALSKVAPKLRQPVMPRLTFHIQQILIEDDLSI